MKGPDPRQDVLIWAVRQDQKTGTLRFATNPYELIDYTPLVVSTSPESLLYYNVGTGSLAKVGGCLKPYLTGGALVRLLTFHPSRTVQTVYHWYQLRHQDLNDGTGPLPNIVAGKVPVDIMSLVYPEGYYLTANERFSFDLETFTQTVFGWKLDLTTNLHGEINKALWRIIQSRKQ